MANIIDFFSKYSPAYGKNNIEGWSVVVVAFIAFAASTYAHSWLGMLGLFLAGGIGAHILACCIKYFVIRNKKMKSE